MKKNILTCIIAILSFIGGIEVLLWGVNIVERVEAQFSESKDFLLKQKKHNEYAKMSYSYGRLWGEVTAQSYDINKEEYSFSEYSYSEIAIKFLDDRIIDFYCWGADDCDDLPNNENLIDRYYVDGRTGNMPIYAFRSGFINSFVEIMELYNKNSR